MNPFFCFGRMKSIAVKEIRHILRDPYMLGLAFGLPLLMVAFFGLIIEFNVKNITLMVYDRDMTRSSRQLSEVFRSSEYFQVVPGQEGVDPVRNLNAERARAVLVIEPGLAKELGSGRPARVQMLIDGADNSTVGVIASYLPGIQSSAIERLTGQRPLVPVRLETRYLFNPELNTHWFIVPGLSAVVMAILAALLTALTVAREWENGSMEMLLATPVRPMEIILGKLSPYLVLGLAVQTLIYLVARLGFGVPFQGSHLIFLLGSLLFLSGYFALGLLISVLTRQQQLAMQFSMVAGLLPSMLLSGFIFPVESMPAFFQYFSMLMPARWFVGIVRSLFLQGTDLSQLAVPFLALTGLNILLVAAAGLKFKTDVE